MGRISGNGIPLNWLVMLLVGVFLGLAVSEARESLVNRSRETVHLTVVGAVTRADLLGRRVAVKGRIALEHALSPGGEKEEAPERAWIPMFNPERTRAMYVEVNLEEVPTDDVREEWVTGMLRPLNRDLKSHLMTSGLLIDGVAPDAQHMIVAGERPPRLWIWLTVAAILAVVLLAMLLVVPLRYTIFRRTRQGLTDVDLRAAAAPTATADAAGDAGLRVTGRFALTPTDTQRFLNVPAVIAELESGETAFVSNIDASIDHMGAVERRAGAWIIVMKHGTLSPPEYGDLYTGRRHPALRIRFTDATTGKPSSAILAFSSASTRDRVREALYDVTRRKRVELALATAPPENPEQKGQQGEAHEV